MKKFGRCMIICMNKMKVFSSRLCQGYAWYVKNITKNPFHRDAEGQEVSPESRPAKEPGSLGRGPGFQSQHLPT